MLSSTDVAIIVLNYRGAKDTIECLRSLYALESLPGMIVVVDNASSDDSIESILTAWKQWDSPCLVYEEDKTNFKCNQKLTENKRAVFLLLSSNNGYASGNNLGVKFIKEICNMSYCAYWILNNDTEVDGKSLQAICERYNKENCPAIIGSTIVFLHDKVTIQCMAGSKFNRFLGTTKSIGQGNNINEIDNVRQNYVEKNLGYISGASLFIHKTIIDIIGYLREDYFLYVEDVEYGQRAKINNIPLFWAKDSIVYHREGGASGASTKSNCNFSRPQWVDYLMLRNRANLIRHLNPLALPVLCASYVAVAMKRLFRKQINRIPLVFKALIDGIVGNMGKINV